MANELSPELQALSDQRAEIYGDPELSHDAIGLMWTGLIQQHYEKKLDHPIPAFLVAEMMVAMKTCRSVRVFHQDNYDDRKVYMSFAKSFIVKPEVTQ